MAKTKAQKAIANRKKKQELPSFGELIEVSLSDVKRHPDNPRVGNKKKLKGSIKELGFISPIVVQKSSMTVMAGNHRVEVAKEMGYKTVPAHIIDCSDKVARKFMLADNKTSDESTYDEEKLAAILADLIESGGEDALAGTGYSAQEADVIRARAAWQDEDDIIPELGDPSEMEKGTSGEAKTGVFKMPQPKDREEAIEGLGRRSIILSLPVKDGRFQSVQDALRSAREGFEVRTNEEALVEMLKERGWLPKSFQIFDADEKRSSKPRKKKSKKK